MLQRWVGRLCFLLLSGCLSAGSSGCATTGPLLPGEKGLPVADPSGKGRILSDERLLRFAVDEGGEPAATERSTRTVLIEGPRSKRLADDFVRYDRTFARVTGLAARSRTPDGKVKLFERDDAADVPMFGGSILYTDDRLLFLNLPDYAAGTVVAQSSEVVMKQPSIFAWSATFGGSVPFDAQSFIVEAPSDWRLEWLTEKGGVVVENAPTKIERDGFVRYTWSRSALPPTILPPLAPSFDDVSETVTVRLASWTAKDGSVVTAPSDDKEASRFNAQLNDGQASASPELIAEVNKALVGVDDNVRAKARRLYAWVRDSVRYCAIEVGMGGWVPHAAPDVFAARAGDCKDKANLLKAMLKVAGIDSHLVAIESADWPGHFRLPVLAANFNHAILAVELPADQGGRVFVDPTSRVAAFGEVPDGDRDRRALLIDDGTGLVDMPASSADLSRRDEVYDLTLGKDGRANGTFAATFSGENADDVRMRLLNEPKKQHDNVVADALALIEPDVDEGTLVIDALQPPEEPTPVRARGKLSIDVVRGAAGVSAMVRTRSFFASPVRGFSEETRAVDALLGAGFGQKTELRLRLPPELRVTVVPADVDANSRFGRYHRSFGIEDDGAVLVLRREAARDQRVLAAGDYDAYRQWAAAVLLADEAAVVLEAVRR